MFGGDIHSLKIMDIPAPPSPLSPSVMRVTDPSQRLSFIPMGYRKTWFVGFFPFCSFNSTTPNARPWVCCNTILDYL